MFEVVEHPIELSRLIVAVGRSDAGAIATFLGTTRDHNAGRQVIRLEYEAYPEMALREMRRIGAQAIDQFSAKAVAIVHRIGIIEIGETSVAIAVSAAHRDAAFAACRFAIDRLKEIVPIWKKEHYRGGEIWIGPQRGGSPSVCDLATT
jgi:molybdopterin synthase catalytic subunit